MDFDIKTFQKNIYESSQQDLKEILFFLEEYSFYDFLFYTTLTINTATQDWTPIADLPISVVEYLISIVLWIEEKDLWTKRADEETCKKFYDTIQKLWKCAWLWTMLFSDDPFVAQISWQFLSVRWHDYDLHLIESLNSLFWKFDDYFTQKLWFTVSDVINIYEKSRIIDKNYPFIYNWIKWNNINIYDFFWAVPWDNKIFFEWTYWWLFWNRSIVPEKSIIKLQENYFIFQPLLILQNIKWNLENELKKDHEIWDKYDKHRANILEENSVKYLTNILPWSKWYINLKYDWKYETDGLIIYDNNLFIIEAKSGVLRKRSTKWDIKALEEDVNKLMLDWYNQWLRTKEYIENNDIAEFIDSKWDKVLINKIDYNRIFLVNTTWDYLWPISIHLDQQKEKWKIQDNVNFWSVYINDLRVISEIIEYPNQFILFLERRIKLTDKPQIHFADELDIFMEFIERWLYYDNWKVHWKNINEFTMFSMDTTLTDKIDRYYWWEWEKPKMKLESEIRNIIESILKSWKRWFSEVATFFLSINPEDNIKMLNLLKDKYLEDGKVHTFTWTFNEQDLIEVIILNDPDNDKYIEYSKIKLVQLWLWKAYNLFFNINNKWEIIFLDFDIVSLQDIDITEDFKKKVSVFKKISQWFNIDINTWKKLNRKSPCPCWSWKKFKRCCWDKYYN